MDRVMVVLLRGLAVSVVVHLVVLLGLVVLGLGLHCEGLVGVRRRRLLQL